MIEFCAKMVIFRIFSNFLHLRWFATGNPNFKVNLERVPVGRLKLLGNLFDH